MKNKHYLQILLLTVIFLIGLFIRLHKLHSIPAGFFCDEAATGYNAYTLLKHGTDEYGISFPVFFRSFGNYRPGIPMYASMLPVALFGLNEFSTRLPTAIVGALTIPGIFFLTFILFSSPVASIISALLLTISPWHIHFTRFAEGIIYLPFFLTLSVALFVFAIKKHSRKTLVLSSLGFGLTPYTYFQGYYIAPLFIISLTLLYRKELFYFPKKILIVCAVVLFITSLPLISGFSTGETLARFNQLSATQKKPLHAVVQKAVTTYIDHFLPEFLFDKGDIGYNTHFITRHSVRGMGELYWFQLPLIIIGLIYAFQKNKKAFAIILIWLVFYPIGSTAALFADGGGPFANRSIIGVVPLQILSAVGFVFFVSILRRKYTKILFILIIFAVLGFSLQDYLHRYFKEYPLYSSDFWGWQYGPREIMKYFLTVKDQYDDLYMSGEFNAGHIFLSFYDPQNTCQSKCKMGDFFREPQIYNSSKRQLFSLSPDYLSKSNFVKNFLVKKIIYYPNGNTAFEIGEIVK